MVAIRTRSVNDKDKLVIADGEFRFVQLGKEIQHHNVLPEDAIWNQNKIHQQHVPKMIEFNRESLNMQ